MAAPHAYLVLDLMRRNPMNTATAMRRAIPIASQRSLTRFSICSPAVGGAGDLEFEGANAATSEVYG